MSAIPSADAEAWKGFAVPIHEYLGLRIVALEPAVRVEMDLTEHVRGATAPVHGGALATLIDVSSSIAAAISGSYDPMADALVTLDLHIRYFSQPKMGPVIAESSLVHKSRKTLCVETAVRDSSARQVARGAASSLVLVGKGLQGSTRIKEGAE